MKPSIPIVLILMGGLSGALLTSGCATKKYVRQQVDPVSGKLDQVSTKSDQQGQTLDQTKQSLDKTRSSLEEDETKLSATNERAVSADNRAGEAITRAEFREQLQKPLVKKLEARSFLHFESRTFPATNGQPRRVRQVVTQATIRYLVLCYGVPLIIVKDPKLREGEAEKLQPTLQRNEAAVDSELACLPILDGMLLAGPHQNPFYGCTNASLFNPTNGILMVARLDGPTAAIARALVDKAMEAEATGLWGRAYFDTRGLDAKSPYKLGDDWILGAAEICRWGIAWTSASADSADCRLESTL